MMMLCAPPAVTPSPVLRPDWETLSRLTSTWSKTLDLDAYSTPSPSHRFVVQPLNHSLLDFKIQTKKPSWWFWGPNHQTVAIGFEVQTKKPSTTLILRLKKRNPPPVLRLNRKKPSPPVLRLNLRKSLPPVLRSNRRKPSPPILRSNRRKLSQWFRG
jgi:hypothetical protein